MKITVLDRLTKDFTCVCLVGRGLNNYTSQSRDIVKALKSYESETGELIPNVNPLVNKFRLFLLQNNLNGIFFDLGNMGEQVAIDIKDGDLFATQKKADSGDKLYRQNDCNITNATRDVCFALATKNTHPEDARQKLWQSLGGFAKELEAIFGGEWCLYDLNSQDNTIVLDNVTTDRQSVGSQEKGSKGIKKRRADSLGFVDKNAITFILHEKLKDKIENYYPEIDFGDDILVNNSANLKFGDFSTNVAFKIAKFTGQKPPDIARDIGVKLSGETDLAGIFASITSAPNGFVNFFLDDAFLVNFLEENRELNVDLPDNNNILIESPSANPNKPLHVGHLLNICLARSLGSLFSKLGFDVHYDNLINDKGLPICKLIWAVRKYALDATPESEGLKPDHFVGKYYTLGAQKFDESKDVEEEVREILRAWESGDKEIVEIWKTLMNYAVEGQADTLIRMGEDMGHMWFESDIYEKGKEMVLDFVDDEKIVKTEDGAVIGKIEQEYGVPDVVLVKSDGTSLYHTQDLYLTILKIKKFKPWKAVWVVGNEQIAHFQKLFSVIDMLDLLPIDNLYHLAYGFVFDKDGKKMSSRTGDALSADELLDMMKEAVFDLGKEVDKDTAESVGVGALKYAFLSSDPYKDMKFDINQAVMFNGRSGPYIMYAYARANNILKKAGKNSANAIKDYELTDLDREILIKCLDYNNIIVAAANNYSPSILAEYLYDLAKLFSQMYETESVLNAEGDEFLVRMMVVKHVKDILEDGLGLLRIQVLEKM